MKTKVLLAVVAMSYSPLVVARNEAAYPKEKVAAFVVEKSGFDFTPVSVPAEEGKRKEDTYGLRIHSAEDGRKRSHHRGAGSSEEVGEIKVLDQKSSGIYVCVAEPGENGGDTKAQSVVLLKRKNPNSLLRGRESFREFSACPGIGGSDFPTSSDGD